MKKSPILTANARTRALQREEQVTALQGKNKLLINNTDLLYKPDDISLPAFWSPLTSDDAVVLTGQNHGKKFSTTEILAVARRCSHGCPQVLLCKPLTADHRPFPTVFWLTCPYLAKRCGELESEHKIRELENIFSVRADSIAIWHKEYAKLRLALISDSDKSELQKRHTKLLEKLISVGVGGINWSEACFAVKCLHLQVGTWLGWGQHPAAEWLKNNFSKIECSDGKCKRYLATL